MISYEEALVKFLPRLQRKAWYLYKDDAEDLTQEAVLRALRYKKAFKPTGSKPLERQLLNWFFSILRNEGRRQYGRRSASRELEEAVFREQLIKPIEPPAPKQKLHVRDVLPWQEYEALLSYVNNDVRRPGDHTYRYRARKRLMALVSEDTEIVWG